MCYTKTRGKAGDEDQELVPPSGSLSSSAVLKTLKYLRQLSGEEGKRLLQGLFPSPCVQQGHPSYPSAAGFASWSHLLQKNILEVPLIHTALKSAGQKRAILAQRRDDYGSIPGFLQVSSKPESGEGVNHLG